MQDLIKKGFFGDQYHPDMVLSVNTGTHIPFARLSMRLVADILHYQFLRLSVEHILYTLSGRSQLVLQTSDSSLWDL